MKTYQIFYIIKANRRETLHHIFVRANNAKEAIAECKRVVKEQTGKNAFRPMTEAQYMRLSEKYVKA